MAVPTLSTFIKRYRDIHTEHEEFDPSLQRSKVAVIDSGVVLVGGKRKIKTNSSISAHIDRQIKDGKSFVHHNVEHPWWHAIGPHGTQMTSLICAIDPRSEIYIARVTESDTSGVSSQRVAEVRSERYRWVKANMSQGYSMGYSSEGGHYITEFNAFRGVE